MKNKGVAVGGILIIVFVVIGIFVYSHYNSIVEANESVLASRQDIDTQLQRRADLIPNLVSTVKGYMEHEKEVIESITDARESLVTADSLEDKSKANNELTKAINNFFLVVENYPDLKASQNFISLQDEIAGSENRISVARKEYNDEVKKYNSLIKKFPANIIASMFDYESAEYFEVSDGAKDVPQVSFE